MPRIRIRGVRHTHATLALQQGANIKAVSQRLGHTRTSITMDVNAHVLPEQAQDVSEKVGAVLSEGALRGHPEAPQARFAVARDISVTSGRHGACKMRLCDNMPRITGSVTRDMWHFCVELARLELATSCVQSGLIGIG